MTDRPYTEADEFTVAHRIAVALNESHRGWQRQVPVARAVLDALTAAGRLLPEPKQTHVEWGVWWHAGNPDGICLDDGYMQSEHEAHERGKSRIGELGIDSYTVVRREHRDYGHAGWWSQHWTRYAGPLTATPPACDGMCLTGSDIGVPSAKIAYPHPGCPLHAPGEVCGCGQPDRCDSPTHDCGPTTKPTETEVSDG